MKRFATAARVITTTIVFFTIVRAGYSQSPQEILAPRVAFYGCNFSAATTDTGAPFAAMQLSTHFLYHAITADTTTRQVYFFSFANAGSDSVDNLIAGGWTPPSPDTGTILGTEYYVVGSVRGNSGGYTLTVYLKDARSKTDIDSGSATFSTSDTLSIKNASSQAASGILPLITKIRAYETQERSANPGLSIDPQVNITLPGLKVAAGQNINVTIETVDYDGYPLKNKKVKLHSSRGSFASSQVQTDGNGQATVAFNPGSGDGVAVVSASMDSTTTVSGLITNADKEAFMLVGNVSLLDSSQYYTTRLYQLDFTLTVKVAGFSDQSSVDPTTITWIQSNWADVYSAHGSIPGYGFSSTLANNFEFTADTGAVWGTMFKTKSDHDVGIHDGDPCWDWDLFEVQTYNGIVDTSELLKHAPGHLSYDGSGSPGNIYEAYYNVPFIYQGNDDSWGLPGGIEQQDGSCQRDDATSLLYYVGQTYGFDEDFHDTDPGASFMKSGDNYTISFTKVDVTEDTVTSLTGYTYQVITTNYNATLKPIQPLTAVDTATSVEVPRRFGLNQNYPNPFNPTTTINYQLPMISNVVLKVYDVLGREVATLVNARQDAGRYLVTFDAGRLPSGVYFYRLQAGNFSETKKLVVVK